MGARALLALIVSAISITETFPSATSPESPPRAPSLGGSFYSTESSGDEIIFLTEVAPHHRLQGSTHQTLDLDDSIMQYPTFPPNTRSTAPDIVTPFENHLEPPIVVTNFMPNPYNDEILEKASRLLDGEYPPKEGMSTEHTWFEGDGILNARDGTKKNLEDSSNADHTKGRLKTLHSVSDPLTKIDEEFARNMEAYQNLNAIRGEDRRVTTSTVGLVWGEVGRGIVAATIDYGKGEVGRRPLVLAGARGRARSGPYFEEEGPPPNITAPAGSTVYLDCRVAMLQDKVVTWASRRADRLQLLTVGKQAYSADRRLALSFRYPSNWRLRILSAKPQDQGLYECQVAAHPPLIRQIHLTVISPEVSIWDESGRAVVERYYKAGSSLQLTCSAVQLLQPPELLAWWKEDEHLTNGISCNVTGSDSATCTLIVDQVTRSHAGTYTCGAFPWPGSGEAVDGGPSAGPPQEGLTVGPDAPYTTSKAEYYANATVAVHVLHGNLIGVAVLPNTGKSVGAAKASYISVQKIILGLSLALYLKSR